MWLNILLIIFGLGSPQYWQLVQQLHDQGCKVYNDYYVSCPNKPPFGVIDIPDDAVEVIAPNEY